MRSKTLLNVFIHNSLSSPLVFGSQEMAKANKFRNNELTSTVWAVWACQTSCSPFSQATAGAEAAPKPLPFTAIRSRDPEIDPRYPTILGSQLPSSHGPHGQDLCHTHLALVDPTGCPHNPQASHPSHCKSFATNQSKKQLRIVNPLSTVVI